jgi:hypothetical protein
MSNLERRIRVLRAFGAEGATLDELLRYNTNHFDQTLVLAPRSYPLADEEFVSTWTSYVKNAGFGKVFDFLKIRLVQLNFPIREGISRCEDYMAATKRGQCVDKMQAATGLVLEQPAQLRLSIYQTPAGKIPVIYTSHRPDFASLVRALTMRNEPLPVPESMGASIVSGYNNWDRIRPYRAACKTDSEWNIEFSRLIPRKELYQDRFLLLSGGYYSGVAPSALDLSDSEWREKSLTIRCEHECAHYLTRRVFSSMRNHLLDELIADYSGIVAAIGYFRPDWFLHFMGLEGFPSYRGTGRFENYRGEPPLSDTAFRILQAIVKSAAELLEVFTKRHAGLLSRPDFRPLAITVLSTQTLEELADVESQETLARIFQQLLDQSQKFVETS